jgi:hypothetical protein
VKEIQGRKDRVGLIHGGFAKRRMDMEEVGLIVEKKVSFILMVFVRGFCRSFIDFLD